MDRVLAASLLLFMAPASFAQDAPSVFVLPAHRLWCGTTTMKAADSDVEELQAKVRVQVIQLLDKALLAAGEAASGYPFLKSSRAKPKANGASDDVVELQLCYLVSPTVAKPTSKDVQDIQVPSGRVAALVCAKSGPRCIDSLQSVLPKLFPNLSGIASLPWREVATRGRPSGEAEQAQALVSAHARPLLGGAEITVFGNVARPDPKKMRPLTGKPTGSVVVVPYEQGDWLTTVVTIPD